MNISQIAEQIKKEAKGMFPKDGNISYIEYGIIISQTVNRTVTATLDAVEKDVPEEKDDPATFSNWTEPEHGWNQCRSQMLENLNKLKQ
jgi:ribosomal silencing factor RsfS